MRGMIKWTSILLLLLVTTASGQDIHIYGFTVIDYGFLGSGARARGMGGAFTGLADDASALTWNPGGLIQVDRIQTSISGAFLPLKLKQSFKSSSNIPDSTTEATFKDNKLKLNYGSFVAPIRIKGHPFMASASYQGNVDLLDETRNWSAVPYAYSSGASIIEDTIRQESRTTVQGGVDMASAGFGTAVYGNLSAGAAINVYTGSFNAAYRAHFIDTIEVDYISETKIVELVYNQAATDAATQKGFNFTAGLFYKAEKLRAGLMIRTPFELITDHDVARRDTLYMREIKTPGGGTPTFPSGPLARLLTLRTKLELPLTLAGGISYQVRPDLVVAADMQFSRFSKSKYLVERERYRYPSETVVVTQPGSVYFNEECAASDTCNYSYFTSSGEKVEVYDEYGLNLRNSLAVRAGAEYMMATSVGQIPLRGGVRVTLQQYTDASSLQRDFFDNVQEGFKLGNRVARTVISVGTGIHWHQIWLDIAAEFNMEKQKEENQAYFGEYSTDRERKNPSVIVNFTGFF